MRYGASVFAFAIGTLTACIAHGQTAETALGGAIGGGAGAAVGSMVGGKKGAIVGGALGGAAGGAVGHKTGGTAGAAIGGAIGGGAGAAIGGDITGGEAAPQPSSRPGAAPTAPRVAHREYEGEDRDSRGRRQIMIPPGHMPPPGKCRVRYPDRPPGQQPPPRACGELRYRVPPGATLVRG